MTSDLPLTPDGWEAAARAALPAQTYDYYAGGAGDERTLRANRDAWSEMDLRPRVLVDVSSVDTSIRLLGLDLPHPVLLAPTAFQKLAHPDGEVATARAAARTGSLLVASSLATATIEEIRAAGAAPLWLQLYVLRDRGLSNELVRRGIASGCRAVCLTVSVPVQGNRERDALNKFRLPDGIEMANFRGYMQAHFPDQGASSGLDRFIGQQFDASLSWKDVDTLRESAGVPVLLKGVLTREDARLAVEHGAAGLIVSNHGGRQLEGAQPTARALVEVLAGVDGRIPVLVDGGVRRGADVVRALGMGAAAVLIGRPYLWGLAVAGQRGVERVVEQLVGDLRRTLALVGRASVRDLDPTVLAR